MATAIFLRVALWAMCIVLGGLGVFFAIISCSTAAVAGDAVVLLAAGLGINYFLARENAR